MIEQKLEDRLNDLETLISLLRRDIDKFRLDFISVLNKLDKIVQNG